MESLFYFVHSAPTNIEEDKKYPAIVLMHGMGSNEQDLPGLLDNLRERYFIFSLRGPLQQGPGFAFFNIERIGMPEEITFNEAIKKVAAFINQIPQHYPVDAESIYCMGFSQGAIVSQSITAMKKAPVAGVFAMSGYLPEIAKTNESLEGVKVFLSHGLEDPVIPYSWNKESKEYFTQHGANVTTFIYNGGHFLTQEILAEIKAFFE